MDSTKLAADASTKASKRYEAIVDEVEQVCAEAAAADGAEDAQNNREHIQRRLPRQLAEAERRRERFEQAKAQIDGQVTKEQKAFDAVQQRQQARESEGKKRRGRPPKQPPQRPSPEGCWASVVGSHGIALASDIDPQQNDQHQLHPMLDQAQTNLAAAGLARSAIDVLLADADYYCDDITDANDEEPQLLIAAVASSRFAAGKAAPDEASTVRRRTGR